MDQAQKPTDPTRRMPIWYLPGPFYQYAEDVKALARRAGARIIDANVTRDRANALPDDQTPTVTVKPEYLPKSAEQIAREEAVLAHFRALSPEQQAAVAAQAAATPVELSPEAQAAIEAATKAAQGAAKAK